MPDAQPAAVAPKPAAPPVAGFDNPEALISQNMAGQRQAVSDERAAVAKGVGELETQRKSFDQVISGLKPPELGTPPKEPSYQQTNPIKAWGSSAMMFAALASLFTRTPLTTAMNSAAAAMKSFREGDQARANAAFQKWKIDTENFYKMHEYQEQQYKDLLGAAEDRAKFDSEAKLAELKAVAGAFGDTAVMYGHNIDAIEHIMEHRDQQAMRMAIEGDKIQQSYLLQSGMASWEKDHPNATADEKIKHLGELRQQVGHQWDDQQINSAVDKFKGQAAAFGKSSGYDGAVNNVQRILSFNLKDPPRSDEVIQQASALDAYIQTINGNRAIRGFQLQLLQHDAGLANQMKIWMQQLHNGGAVSRDMIAGMQRLAADYTHVATLQFGEWVTQQQWQHHKVGLDPTLFNPPNYQPERDVMRGQFPAPTAEATAHLKANDTSENWKQFDEVFGQGAAAEVFAGSE